jgi:hypothetical protein
MAAQFYDKLLEHPFSTTPKPRDCGSPTPTLERVRKSDRRVNDFERLHRRAGSRVRRVFVMAYSIGRVRSIATAATENAKLQFQRVLSRYGTRSTGGLRRFESHSATSCSPGTN